MNATITRRNISVFLTGCESACTPWSAEFMTPSLSHLRTASVVLLIRIAFRELAGECGRFAEALDKSGYGVGGGGGGGFFDDGDEGAADYGGVGEFAYGGDVFGG